MKHAWVENNRVRDVTSLNPEEVFTAEIAAFYNTEVEDYVLNGAELVDGVWVNPVPSDLPPETVPVPVTPDIKVSPVEFKLLFTSAERIAIKAARVTNPVVDDFFDIVEDPRLTHVNLSLNSTKDAINYLEAEGLIGEGRAAQILSGQAQ